MLKKEHRLVRFEENKTCEEYNFKKNKWENGFKTFGKMCLGSIEVEEITKKEVKELINK